MLKSGLTNVGFDRSKKAAVEVKAAEAALNKLLASGMSVDENLTKLK